MTEPESTPFDLLIRGPTVLTSDPANPLLESAVIGILGQRIALMCTAKEAPADLYAPRVLELPGRVVTPGFVNVHTHAVLCLLRGVSEDMGFAPAYTRGVPHGHEIDPAEAVALARLGAMEALRFGSTLINDSYVHADHTLPAMGELGLRVHACGRIHDVDFTRVHDGIWEYDRAIGTRTLGEALTLAERWHGKMDGRMGVQLAPHAPDTCSRALLADVGRAREETGLRVNTHLAQSAIEVERVRGRDGVAPPELLEDLGLLDEHLIAAHCLFVNDTDIARIGRAGVTVAHAPKVNIIGGYRAPTSALRRAGARLALATDAMHGDMVENMRWALAAGRLQEGRVDDTWHPRHVFEMATVNGACAMALEDEVGSLGVGKKADLVIFDFHQAHLTPCRSPLGNLVHVAQGRDVEHVIVDGRVVIESGRATLVDEDEIRREAEAASQRIWARAIG